MGKRVVVYAMRHGEKLVVGGKATDTLSLLGLRQVAGAAGRHLAGITFHHAVSSEMARARQTTVVVLGMIGQGTIPIYRDDGFGFAGVSGDSIPSFPLAEAKKAVGKESPTVWDMLVHWPPAWLLRGQTMLALKRWASYVAQAGYDAHPLNIFVAGHSPGLDMAVLDPANFPCLREADIIKFELDVDEDSNAVIVGNTHLPCPPVS